MKESAQAAFSWVKTHAKDLGIDEEDFQNLDTHVHATTHTSTHNSYICGNALEALVGAVYLDQGYNRCRKFIINRLVKKHFDLTDLVKTEQNFKSRLIEWTQKYRVTLEFELVDTYATEAEAEAAGAAMAEEFVDSDEGYEVTAHGELPVM